jgi:hypothetical protein
VLAAIIVSSEKDDYPEATEDIYTAVWYITVTADSEVTLTYTVCI